MILSVAKLVKPDAQFAAIDNTKDLQEQYDDVLKNINANGIEVPIALGKNNIKSLPVQEEILEKLALEVLPEDDMLQYVNRLYKRAHKPNKIANLEEVLQPGNMCAFLGAKYPNYKALSDESA